MDIRVAQEDDKSLWDKIIYESPDSTIFHTWKWLSIMEKYSQKKIFKTSFSPKLYRIVVHEKNDIIGLIPIYHYQTPVGSWAHSPPDGVECLYLGPIFHNLRQVRPRERYHMYTEFQNNLHKFLVGTLHANSIKIRSSSGFVDPRGFGWNGYDIEPRFTYFLNLKVGKEEVWKNFRKTLKNSISRSQKLGLQCIEGSKSDLDFIYSLMRTRERIHAPKEFLDEVFDAYNPENVKVFLAKNGEDILSGIIMIIFKNKVSFWIGSPKVMFQGVSPNEFILWTVIQWAINQGFEYFEIVGADDSTLYSFKNKFNAELVQEYWAKWYSPVYRFANGVYKLIRDQR